jgi:hypothetical protein
MLITLDRTKNCIIQWWCRIYFSCHWRQGKRPTDHVVLTTLMIFLIIINQYVYKKGNLEKFLEMDKICIQNNKLYLIEETQYLIFGNTRRFAE